uniref:Secreted protein n=1 Tax=Anopheles darlingi TaxID=43151 RepID=A0A2M4DE16_ANODA
MRNNLLMLLSCHLFNTLVFWAFGVSQQTVDQLSTTLLMDEFPDENRAFLHSCYVILKYFLKCYGIHSAREKACSAVNAQEVVFQTAIQQYNSRRSIRAPPQIGAVLIAGLQTRILDAFPGINITQNKPAVCWIAFARRLQFGRSHSHSMERGGFCCMNRRKILFYAFRLCHGAGLASLVCSFFGLLGSLHSFPEQRVANQCADDGDVCSDNNVFDAAMF